MTRAPCPPENSSTSPAVYTLASYGVKISGFSDLFGAIWSDHGIDSNKLRKHVARTGTARGLFA